MNIWLIGMMGSGKTTVGRLVAAGIGLPFHDVDLIVQDRLQQSIPELWESMAEDTFRSVEASIIAELAGGTGGVVSTGGGAILSRANRNAMRRSGTVVWLKASPAVLATRVAGSRDRPLLGAGGEARLGELLGERLAFYEEAAHHSLITEERTPMDVADEVRKWV